MQTNPFHIVRRPNFRTQFQPKVRGDFSDALKDTTSLAHIQPQSPRPQEMLVGCEYDLGGVDFSSNDHAVFEALVTNGYDGDPRMLKTSYEIPQSDLLHLLGIDARPEALEASLMRLEKVRVSFHGSEDRTYKRVQLITTWERIKGPEKQVSIGYQFPDPIRELMRTMPRYAYIEHLALSQGNMGSRYSAVIYKWLAFEVSKNPWKPDNDNRFTVTITAEALADMLQLPRVKGGRIDFSRLKSRVLDKLAADLKSVQKFSVEIAYDGEPKPKSGRTVEMIDFNVVVHADFYRVTSSKRAATTPELDEALKNVQFGAPDAPELRLPSAFWRRVVRNKGMKCLQLLENAVHPVWVVALQEAIDADPISENYHTRQFRGPKLLEAIRNRGVEDAAWQFLAEEAALGADVVRSSQFHERLPKARRAQLERFRASKAKADEPTVPAAAPVAIEAPVQNQPMPVAEPAAPKPVAEVVPFEQCTHVELTVKEVSTTTFEMDVLNKVKDIVWFHGPRRTLRFRYLSGGGYATLDLPIMLEFEDDLIHELKVCKADRFIEMNEIVYLKVTK